MDFIVANNYTSIFEVVNDVTMYNRVRSGDPLTLGNLQTLTKLRWEWFVANWPIIKETYIALSNGNSSNMSAAEQAQSLVDSYNLGNTKNNPFNKFQIFVELNPILESIKVNSLNLSPEERNEVANQTQRILNLQIEDFRSAIKFLKEVQVSAFQDIGMGDSDGDALISNTKNSKKRQPTLTDLEVINDLAQIVKYIEGFIFDKQQEDKRPPNLLAAANTNLGPESQFEVFTGYQSGIQVPFEISLEHMANIYLGSKDLWYELATVNNLQPPFVDEAGTKFALLAPGGANNVIVDAAAGERLSVGTKLKIGSFRVREEVRVVEKIIKNENNTMILYLSGDQTIGRFQPSEKAFIRVFLPGTTRRDEFIIIPSVAGTGTVSKTTTTNIKYRDLPQALKQFGIDLDRNLNTRDFVIDPNGNFKTAVGVDAIRNRVLNMLKTRVGELPFHPEFGIDIGIGDKYFGTVDEVLLTNELLRNTILSDPRFNNVLVKNLSATGNGMALELVVSIAGFNKAIPLKFST